MFEGIVQALLHNAKAAHLNVGRQTPVEPEHREVNEHGVPLLEVIDIAAQGGH